MELRAVTYNIRNCEGMDGKVDLPRVSLVLKSLNADIISLQEVDMRRPRTFLVRQANALANSLHMGCTYGLAERCHPGSFGNAILSRYPIVASINRQLPAENSKRAILEAKLNINGSILRVFNTHMELDWGLRLEQIENFIVPLVISDDTPAILTGDLNETPDSPGVKYLLNYFNDSFTVNSGPLTATFSSDNPIERMDYIFLYQDCTALDYHIIPSNASDHLPVCSKILI